MKKAFTLAETLISITIIGLIAAIVAPVISNSRPDESKVLYLKAYDSLTGAVQSLVTNSTLYPSFYDAGNGQYYNVSAYPFLNENVGDDPTNYPAPTYSGEVKFANLLIYTMNGTDSNYDSDASSQTIQFKTNNKKFIWQIKPRIYTMGTGVASWSTVILVDINGDSSMNKMYIPNRKEDTPTTFQFCITAAGNVIPADVYGQMYIDDRQNFKKNKDEKEILKAGIQSGKYSDRTSLGKTPIYPELWVPISHIKYEY